jgi:hypothetical protein
MWLRQVAIPLKDHRTWKLLRDIRASFGSGPLPRQSPIGESACPATPTRRSFSNRVLTLTGARGGVRAHSRKRRDDPARCHNGASDGRGRSQRLRESRERYRVGASFAPAQIPTRPDSLRVRMVAMRSANQRLQPMTGFCSCFFLLLFLEDQRALSNGCSQQ